VLIYARSLAPNFPKHSLESVLDTTSASATVIDVGCGASFLVDSFIEECYGDITLLDMAKTSLEIVKERFTRLYVVSPVYRR